MANNVHVKVDDTVIVLSGKYKNTVGKVWQLAPKKAR